MTLRNGGGLAASLSVHTHTRCACVFIGSLGEYQRRLAQPISRGNEESASLKAKEAGAAAAEQLRGLLGKKLHWSLNNISNAFSPPYASAYEHADYIYSGKIMLRRTQADILSTLLPARHDYVVYCTPTTQQAQHYEIGAETVLRYASMTAILRMELLLQAFVDHFRSVGLSGTAEDSGSEAEEVRGSAAVSTEVLSGLQKLRGICNSCAKQESFVGGAGGKAGNSFASAWRLHQQKGNMSGATVNQVLGVGRVKSDGGQRASGNSAKLQVCVPQYVPPHVVGCGVNDFLVCTFSAAIVVPYALPDGAAETVPHREGGSGVQLHQHAR